jgi:hypothetical protein
LLIVVAASASTVLICVLIHYEFLRGLSCATPRLTIRPRKRILVIVLSAILGHICEVVVFAAGFWLLSVHGMPRSEGLEHPMALSKALYFSFECYASLGSVDFPDGPIRLFGGMEALTGLLLIGWTSSYTYLAMRDLWDSH